MLVVCGKTKELNLGSVRGWLVIDLMIMGMCWGGVRIQPHVSKSETALLARLMTLKSALAGLPIGGAKIGIAAHSSALSKIIENLANTLHSLLVSRRYIPGTDMGFSEEDLEKLYRKLKLHPSSTLHKATEGISFTGLAVAESLKSSIAGVIETYEIDECETIALQGFGNMGSASAYVLSQCGYRIIAVANKDCTLVDSRGISVGHLLDLKNRYGEECLRQYHTRTSGSRLLSPEKLFEVKADIHVPGAGVLAVQKRPECRILAPIANYPISISFAKQLELQGVKVVPDIISTAGGAIGSALSLLGRSFEADREVIAKITRRNLREVILKAQEKSVTSIEEAYRKAWKKVTRLRKLGLFGLTAYVEPLAEAAGFDIFTSFFKLLKHRVSPI